MPFFNCADPPVLTGIDRFVGCNRPGLSYAFWAKVEDIDLDATVYDAATNTITSWVMQGGGTFKALYPDPKTAQYNAEYSNETGVYTQLVNLIFIGKGAAQSAAIRAAVANCALVLVVYSNDCQSRVFGIEYDPVAESLIIQSLPLEVSAHRDLSAVSGGADKSRDEVDMAGESFYEPPFTDVAIDEIPSES